MDIKKIGAGVVAAVAVTGAAWGLAATSGADGPPPHGHIMLLHVDEEELTYRKCVDLAAGRAVPTHAHHANLHVGRAGIALTRAGHAVIPTESILPPELHGKLYLPASCAEVDAWIETLREE